MVLSQPATIQMCRCVLWRRAYQLLGGSWAGRFFGYQAREAHHHDWSPYRMYVYVDSSSSQCYGVKHTRLLIGWPAAPALLPPAPQIVASPGGFSPERRTFYRVSLDS